jgi:hypothetical protein
MYFLDFQKMMLVPLQIKNFRLNFANTKDCEFILGRLNKAAPYAARFSEASDLPFSSFIYEQLPL